MHVEAFGLSLAAIIVSSCVAIWGLARAAVRPVLAGAAGIAVGSVIFMLAAASVGDSGFFSALFVVVLGLAVAVALVGLAPAAAYSRRRARTMSR